MVGVVCGIPSSLYKNILQIRRKITSGCDNNSIVVEQLALELKNVEVAQY